MASNSPTGMGVIIGSGQAQGGTTQKGGFRLIPAGAVGSALRPSESAALSQRKYQEAQARRRGRAFGKKPIPFKSWPVAAGKCQPKISTSVSERLDIPGVGASYVSLPGADEGKFICQAPIAFSEQNNPAREQDIRVFIEGVEVTAYIRGNVRYSIEGTGGMNTCSFTLNNNQDAFVITPLNVCSNLSPNGWRLDPLGLQAQVSHSEPRYDELAKYLIYKRKFERVNPNSNRAEIDPQTGMWLYPLAPYSSIINKHDCVRIFKKLAHIDGVKTYKQTAKGKVGRYYDLWVPAWTGFVRSAPWQDDYVGGDRSMTVECYDYRGLMERMRVRTVGLPLKTDGTKTTGNKYAGTIAEAIIGKGGKNQDALASATKHGLTGMLDDYYNQLRKNCLSSCVPKDLTSQRAQALNCLMSCNAAAVAGVAKYGSTINQLEANFARDSEAILWIDAIEAYLSVIPDKDVQLFLTKKKTAAQELLNQTGTIERLNKAAGPSGTPKAPPVNTTDLSVGPLDYPLAGMGTTSETVSTTGQISADQINQLKQSGAVIVDAQGKIVGTKPVISVDLSALNVLGNTEPTKTETATGGEPQIMAAGAVDTLQALASFFDRDLLNEVQQPAWESYPETVAALIKKARENAANGIYTSVAQYTITKLSKERASVEYLASAIPGLYDPKKGVAKVTTANRVAMKNIAQQGSNKLKQQAAYLKSKLEATAKLMNALIIDLNKALKAAQAAEAAAKRKNTSLKPEFIDSKVAELEAALGDARAKGQAKIDDKGIGGAGNMAELILNEPTFDGRQAGIFADLIRSVTKNDHPLAGMSFEESVYWLCCSNSFVVPGALVEVSGYDKSSAGRLAGWNKVCLFGMMQRPLTYDEVTAIGRASHGDYHKSVFSPFKLFLHFLLPSRGTGARTIVQQDLTANTGNATSIQYQTRKSLLDQISDLLAYCYYCTPFGDLAFEFPHYNGDPQIWGETFAGAYTLEKELTGLTVDEEGGDLYTAWTVTGHAIERGEPMPEEARGTLATISVIAPILARRYGVRKEDINMQIPGVGGQLSDTNQAAGGLRSLVAYAFLHIQKQMGEQYRVSIPDFPNRPYLLPNRVLWVVPRQKMCLINSVSESFDLPNGEATSGVQCGFTRWMFRDGSFRTIGGGSSPIIDYAGIFTGALTYRIREGVGNARSSSGNPGRQNNSKQAYGDTGASCAPRLKNAYIQSSSFYNQELTSTDWSQYGKEVVGSGGEEGMIPPTLQFGEGRFGSSLYRMAENPGEKGEDIFQPEQAGFRVESGYSAKEKKKKTKNAFDITSLFHNPYPWGEYRKGNEAFNNFGYLRVSHKNGNNGFNTVKGDIEKKWHGGVDIMVKSGSAVLSPINLRLIQSFLEVGPGATRSGKTAYVLYKITTTTAGSGRSVKEFNGVKQFEVPRSKPQVKVKKSGGTTVIEEYLCIYKIHQSYWQEIFDASDGFSIGPSRSLMEPAAGLWMMGRGFVSLPGATSDNGFEGKQLQCILIFAHLSKLWGRKNSKQKMEYFGLHRSMTNSTAGEKIAEAGFVNTSTDHLHLEMKIFPPTSQDGKSYGSDPDAFEQVVKANNEYLTTQLLLSFSGGNVNSNDLSPFWKAKFKKQGITNVQQAVDWYLVNNKGIQSELMTMQETIRSGNQVLSTHPFFFFTPDQICPDAAKLMDRVNPETYHSSDTYYDNLQSTQYAPPPICGKLTPENQKKIQVQQTECILNARKKPISLYRDIARAAAACSKTAQKDADALVKDQQKQKREKDRLRREAELQARRARQQRKPSTPARPRSSSGTGTQSGGGKTK